MKTMMRSLDTLIPQKQEHVNKFFHPNLMEEPFGGWAPEIKELNEVEMKKLEKQEDRQNRYKNRPNNRR